MPSSDHEDCLRFATLASIATVTAVVSSLGAPLVPAIADAHSVPLSTAQWVLTAALLSGAVATPVLGRVGEGSLRRPILLGGLTVVMMGTLLSAAPLGVGTLIAGRALQGIGMALVPLAFAAARDLWVGDQLLSRLALLSVMTVTGAGLGYPVTTVVAQLTSVTGAYLFGAALVGSSLVLAARHLPRAVDRNTPSIDWVGAALLCSGSVALLLAVSQGEQWGWAASPITTLVVLGLLLTSSWILWSLRRSSRQLSVLVDLNLAAMPGVRAPNVVTCVIGVSLYGLFSLAVLLVQADGSGGFGLDAGLATSGLVLTPYAASSIAANRLALLTTRHFGTGPVLPAGCLLFGSACALLVVWHHTLWQVLVVMAVAGLGGGLTFSSMAMLIVPRVPTASTGSAMAFNQLLRYMAFSVGAAASVALFTQFGGDRAAFRSVSLICAALCFAATVGTVGAQLLKKS